MRSLIDNGSRRCRTIAASGTILLLLAGAAMAQGSAPASPASAQPTLPPGDGGSGKAQPLPVVDSIVGRPQPDTDTRKPTMHRRNPRRRSIVHRYAPPIDVDRPALAGVVLVEPIAPRVERPRPIVLAPAYFVDGIASALTTPPPPVVCERRPRDPDLPDPRLYREVPLACGYDIE